VSVTVAIQFPLGRYHATPWDRSVNEGAVEWPPAPWRVLRALVATWYTRWPDLPAPVLDGILDALGDPPSYLTPPATPGHTRHYLPDLSHKKGETGATDLTLDPYLRVPKDADLLVRWDADLTGEQRETLAKLVELVPYLGRAESVCQARLLVEETTPDGTWWRPLSDGGAGVDTGVETARLLVPRRPVRRPALELSTVEVRRQRRTVPAESTWVTYGRTLPDVEARGEQRRPAGTVTALRFAVMSRAPLMATHGVLLADLARHRVLHKLDGGRPDLAGRGGAATDHQHAHWLPIPGSGPEAESVTALVIWMPRGLTGEEVSTISHPKCLQELTSRRGGADGYEIKGFPPMDLLLQAAGTIDMVAPELCGPARTWRSLTPYLPVRHRKRESLDDYLRNDVATELGYRDRPEAAVTRANPNEGLPDLWARRYRRYRIKNHRGEARPGLGLRLGFEAAQAGPVVLGGLSHFGFGIFMPDV
jgi:CRISPR-associated protein Csb2